MPWSIPCIPKLNLKTGLGTLTVSVFGPSTKNGRYEIPSFGLSDDWIFSLVHCAFFLQSNQIKNSFPPSSPSSSRQYLFRRCMCFELLSAELFS